MNFKILLKTFHYPLSSKIERENRICPIGCHVYLDNLSKFQTMTELFFLKKNDPVVF